MEQEQEQEELERYAGSRKSYVAGGGPSGAGRTSMLGAMRPVGMAAAMGMERDSAYQERRRSQESKQFQTT